MNLSGQPDDIMQEILRGCPEAEKALVRAGHIRGQLYAYQAAALYALASQYERGRILEIGTFVGYSAALLAQAAPHAEIVTLNPALHEVMDARRNLEPWPNVSVVPARSWEYLVTYAGPAPDGARGPAPDGARGPAWDMVFVDGDHKHCWSDMPWWNHLSVGGLMLFHDYTPAGSPHVVGAVDELGARLRRRPDVRIIDNDGVGMAGFYRREKDPGREDGSRSD